MNLPTHPTDRTCPSTETLAALVDGMLSQAERNRTIAHLDGCPACLHVVANTMRAIHLDGDTARYIRAVINVNREPSRPLLSRRQLVMAITLAALVTLYLAMFT